MSRPLARLKTLALCMGLTGLTACATTDKAWEAYAKAEDYYQQENFREAELWYRKALEQASTDGTLVLSETLRYRWTGSGTALRREVYRSVDERPYIPNRRLAEMAQKREQLLTQADREFKKLSPPALKLNFSLSDEDGDQQLQVGEPATLIVEVANHGPSPAHQVVLFVEHDQAPAARRSQQFAMIKSGESVFYKYPFTLPKDFTAPELNWTLRADEMDGYTPPAIEAAMRVEPIHPPRLSLRQVATTPIVPGQSTELSFELKNEGQWSVRDIDLSLKFEPAEHISVIAHRWPEHIGLLRAGEQITLRSQVQASVLLNAATPLSTHFFWKQGEQAPQTLAQLSLPVIAMPTLQYAASSLPTGTQGLVTVADAFVPPITTQGQKQPNSYAFVIGNAHYKNLPKQPVKYALEDARTMAEVFQKSVGIPGDNVRVLENATLGELQTLFGRRGEEGVMHQMLDTGQPVDTLYLYYSGHGIPSINRKWSSYLMPSDGMVDYIDQSGYALDTLYRQLEMVRAKQIVVMLDACFSGQSSAGALFPNTSPGTLIRPRMPENRDPRLTILSATGDGDMAIWLDSSGHGLFTNYLARGLHGEADDGDRTLYTRELYDYVHARVKQVAAKMNRRQRPTLEGGQNLVIATFNQE